LTSAVILSAGQGRRLLPLTQSRPKCLVAIQSERTLLEVQLETLASCGIADATVMVGFGAEAVEAHLARRTPAGIRVRTCFNPVHAQADNLVTAWLAREHLHGDVMLLNGDTLFEAEVVRRLLREPHAPACAAVSRKASYDHDDMKVRLDADGCVRDIGKRLLGDPPDGEAIGVTRLREAGAAAFREALETVVRTPDAPRLWYTSALQTLAGRIPVRAIDIADLWWSEIDDLEDLERVRARFAQRHPASRSAAVAST
jgi:choline kinase